MTTRLNCQQKVDIFMHSISVRSRVNGWNGNPDACSKLILHETPHPLYYSEASSVPYLICWQSLFVMSIQTKITVGCRCYRSSNDPHHAIPESLLDFHERDQKADATLSVGLQSYKPCSFLLLFSLFKFLLDEPVTLLHAHDCTRAAPG